MQSENSEIIDILTIKEEHSVKSNNNFNKLKKRKYIVHTIHPIFAL